MDVVGIVAEYNPFHAGHAFHIAETRRQLGECAVVAVMSGNFVQRGDCAVLDKWTRARTALEGGVDLVLELPTVWAVSSAESFARGAVEILSATGVVTHLSFGSECGDGDKLRQVADCLDSEVYRAGLRRFLDEGMPFAACRQAVVRGLLGEDLASLLSQPNNNLGIEYIRALKALERAIQPVTVLRAGAAHDGGDHPDYPSASFLRERILAGGLPADNPASLKYGERGALAVLRAMDGEDFTALPDCGEGLSHRLYRAARQGRTLEEVYDLAKTKRYAHSRIRRAALWGALGLRECDRPAHPTYLRVLGASGRGREALREMKTKATLPIVTKPAHGRGIPLLELEARCTDFYQLCCQRPGPCGLEWTTNPVML
ncbi:MAG: nucleotidyltransferase family protein [Oscillospiraceae bacterium]|nr:nucleotidyltransferase family protein [Oscillospiraceae bacterium]